MHDAQQQYGTFIHIIQAGSVGLQQPSMTHYSNERTPSKDSHAHQDKLTQWWRCWLFKRTCMTTRYSFHNCEAKTRKREYILQPINPIPNCSSSLSVRSWYPDSEFSKDWNTKLHAKFIQAVDIDYLVGSQEHTSCWHEFDLRYTERLLLKHR